MNCTDCKNFEWCRGSMQMGTNCFVPKEKEYDITSESAFHNYDLGYEEGYEHGKKDAVIHAHWKLGYCDCGLFYICSKCDVGFKSITEYCPHCGAKMDVEVSE